MSNYQPTSPYYGTPMLSGNIMDVANFKPIPKNLTDTVYTIGTVYNLRPDLLAADLYGDSALWWVFAMRNPNVLKDPLFDFKLGNTIYLPNKDALKERLGL